MKTEIIKISEDGSTVIYNDHIFNILCFKKLKGRCKKGELDMIMKFIYYVCDSDSIYATVPSELRESMVKEDYLNDKNFVIDDVLRECMNKYVALTETIYERAVRAVRKKLENFISTVDENDLTLDSAKKFSDLFKLLPMFASGEKKLNEQIMMDEKDIQKDKSMFE